MWQGGAGNEKWRSQIDRHCGNDSVGACCGGISKVLKLRLSGYYEDAVDGRERLDDVSDLRLEG